MVIHKKADHIRNGNVVYSKNISFGWSTVQERMNGLNNENDYEHMRPATAYGERE